MVKQGEFMVEKWEMVEQKHKKGFVMLQLMLAQQRGQVLFQWEQQKQSVQEWQQEVQELYEQMEQWKWVQWVQAWKQQK